MYITLPNKKQVMLDDCQRILLNFAIFHDFYSIDPCAGSEVKVGSFQWWSVDDWLIWWVYLS